jgi:hypothetical protein
MGGRGAVRTPTRTLPHQGGGERFEGAAHDMLAPVSLVGEGWDGEKRFEGDAYGIPPPVYLLVGNHKGWTANETDVEMATPRRR